MSIYEKLLAVQSKLKAPKNQHCGFGNYNYRSAEDILEAVKPLLQDNGATVILQDDIVNAGNYFYIRASARFIDVETGDAIETAAYARESDSKKGMDSSQVTGSTSSYARKYALNGLFLIDDTKDADTNEYKKYSAISEQEAADLESYIIKNGFHVDSVCESYKVANLKCLTPEQKAKIVEYINKNKKEGKA